MNHDRYRHRVLPFDMGDDGFEGEDKPIISRWKDELPLIVLAGLR